MLAMYTSVFCYYQDWHEKPDRRSLKRRSYQVSLSVWNNSWTNDIQSLSHLSHSCSFWSQLRTKYFKNKSQSNYLLFKKQRNFYSKLYKEEKKKYYDALDIKNIADNKKFSKTINPFLSEKIKTSSIE